MAKNCLVTRLKSTVNNDNLKYLEYFVIDFKNFHSSDVNINIQYSQGVCKIVGTTFSDGTSEKSGAIISSYLPENESFKLLVPKYYVTYLIVSGNSQFNNVSFSIEDIKSNNLLQLNLQNCSGATGNISSLVGNNSIEVFNMYSTNVTGNVDVLSDIFQNSVNNILLYLNSYITGSIKNMLDSLATKQLGLSKKSIVCYYSGAASLEGLSINAAPWECDFDGNGAYNIYNL